jgi:SAM-dependent methyltransferase
MKAANVPWRVYFRNGMGRRLSMLGEKLGIHWLVYNPLLFRDFHDEAVKSAPGVMRAMRRVLPDARRCVDVGCGSGAYAAEARRQGLDAVGCEHNSTGRRWAARQGVQCLPFDLTRDPPCELSGPFDFAYCFEVAEHLPPELGEKLVRYISTLAPLAVFTAAHPGQGGTGHINEQPRDYWIERFARAGMKHCAEASKALADEFRAESIKAFWLIENVMVFRKNGTGS